MYILFQQSKPHDSCYFLPKCEIAWSEYSVTSVYKNVLSIYGHCQTSISDIECLQFLNLNSDCSSISLNADVILHCNGYLLCELMRTITSFPHFVKSVLRFIKFQLKVNSSVNHYMLVKTLLVVPFNPPTLMIDRRG